MKIDLRVTDSARVIRFQTFDMLSLTDQKVTVNVPAHHIHPDLNLREVSE